MEGRRERLLELAAYLALHPGSTVEAAGRALTAGTPMSPAAANSLVSRLRSWLGTNPQDGTKYLPENSGTGLRLHPAVSCDWSDFARLARRGGQRGPAGVGDLRVALTLVRGRPLSGIGVVGWDWADALAQAMISEIADVAVAVAEAGIAAGDPAGALHAAAIGLGAAPEVERLHRARIMAAHRLRDHDEVRRALRDLESMLAKLDVDMEPETQALYRGMSSA